MDGFQKFDVLPQGGRRNMARNSMNLKSIKRYFQTHKRAKWVVVILLVLFVLSIFTIIIPGINTYKSAKITYAEVKVAEAAIKKQDITQAGVELKKVRTDLTQTQKDLNSMGVLNFLPIAHGYYSDAQHLMKAGFYGLDAADVLVASIEPYADVLGLKGQGSFVGGTASQRIETAVKTLGKVTPKIDTLSDLLDKAKVEIDQVDPNHYPPFLGGEKIRKNLTDLKNLTDQSSMFVSEAKPLIKVLPGVLGEPDTKKYMVIFQNDKELRPTGGFITAYAIFNVSHGSFTVDQSNDIYTLDNTLANKPTAPRIILDYLPKVYEFNLRDSNLSPDFGVSMDTFNSMYKKAGGYVPVDGIIAIDTRALVSAMNILGDIDAGGQTFTTKNNPRCDCPDVIFQLEQYADQPVNYERGNRKDIIGQLMLAIMNKAFSSSPKLYWGPLFQTMLTGINQKDILFDLNNSDAQKGLEGLNAAGKILPFEGDYLHINEANFGGAKSNLFVSETVNTDYNIQSDGSIVKTLTINYKNPYPPSDCNLERGGLCLNATLRDFIRVYVPKGSQLMDSKGSEVKMKTYDELGKTVFEGFLTVRPQGAAKYTLTYKLPFKPSGKTLPLMIQKQPGTDAFQYTITEGNRQLNQFNLSSDKTLNVTLR